MKFCISPTCLSKRPVGEDCLWMLAGVPALLLPASDGGFFLACGPTSGRKPMNSMQFMQRRDGVMLSLWWRAA
jgi:hypothetical protein